MKAAAEAGAGPGLGPLLGTGSVSLVVSSSLNAFRTHKRYSTGLTIAEFKCKLELVVGSPASCMDLELYGAEEQLLGRLDCDEALLGSYPVANGCRVHNPFGPSSASGVGDVTTPKGRGAGRMSSSNAGPRKQRWRPPSPLVPVAKSGYRDNPPNLPPSCQTDFKPGYWVGVRYDEPLGKHDGSVGGRRYFECQPKYGAFVKPQSVTPGDFPEEDNGLEDEL
ncbi:tubulin-folding cofactor B isoform X3 [Buteo buteo]|uniref:tubulin-folding cofactor B isoform X3 n=1 Tax=Buteo buteo TaxID=30397 RepID=UPI003EBA3BB0